MGVSAFAQPTLDPDKDAKVIFTQTFEDDWDHWQSTPVDTIKIIEYYDHAYEGNKAFSEPWNNRSQWQKGVFRTDSVTPGHTGGIMMYNGVKVADNMDESGRFWKKDDYKILKDDGDDRAKAFALYGEDEITRLYQEAKGNNEKYLHVPTEWVATQWAINWLADAENRKIAREFERKFWACFAPL